MACNIQVGAFLILRLMISITLLLSCTKKKDPTLFTIRTGPECGIDFQNTITTNDSLNALTFEYIYNGSGIGVGDFNNDGLLDLFFGGNQVSSRLYLNKGDLQFTDITEQAGIGTNRWVTGVAVVDVNQDGWLDVYLCAAGKTDAEGRRNLLYINKGLCDGVPVFEESARDYGLDDARYGTMAAFFDYDKDGDLDMYLVNNWLETFNRNNLRPKRVKGEAESTDRLFRNNGDGTFTDVSEEAGILIEGYGLGITICDINQDSWPDIYVANDFMSNDLLWVNQRDGTFKNMIGEYLKHQTHNGMGVDIADFNNDALVDIVVVDMLPPGHKRQKLMTPGQNYDHFHMSLAQGYEPQYMRNTLQLNRGTTEDGRVLFSEIAFMAGMAQTDWSWAPLFADFDNDGYKDLFIGNGYRKDVTDLDFIFFGVGGSPFGTAEKRRELFFKELDELPEVKLTNYMYRNTSSLVFEDVTKTWGIELPTFSNGTVYADLDNDGDLDLVTNNIDQEVILYENRLNNLPGNKNNFIRMVNSQTNSFGEKIWVHADGNVQYFEMTPYRGFQSTVEPYAHAGLGSKTSVDSLIILWPDSNCLVQYNVPAGTVIRYDQKEAKPVVKKNPVGNKPLFEPVEIVDYKHEEKSPSDIKATRTLLHELTRYGPCMAKGDVNGDQLDDFFIGGEKGTAAKIFIQQTDGTFTGNDLSEDTTHEDGDALFFDIDNDGDLDLYVASASPFGNEEAKPHRIYLNDGTGKFTRSPSSLPTITTSASCVVSADFDNDGDMDLFIGGRFKAGEYPLSPRSYILRNDNGKLVDVTESVLPFMMNPGMISSAIWADVDNDGKADLITAGEWEPIRIFRNEGTKFTDVSEAYGLRNLNGWWHCIQVADLNNDGFIDIVAGNTGKNSFFRPTPEHPVQITAKDFDNNGSIDPIVTYYNPVEKDRFMVHNRMVVIDQIPPIKRRFETFTEFATTPFSKTLGKVDMEGAVTLSASKLESVVLLNQGGKKFSTIDLPEIAQISTIHDMLLEDIDGDGNIDLIAVGNSHDHETLFGWYDASIGTILLNDGNLNWKKASPAKGNFIVEGDARYINLLQTVQGKVIVVTQNNDRLLGFRVIGGKRE